jgi:signal transduction histidine kinase
MGFEIAQTESPRAAHTAVLDFGFGDLLLNLHETNPAWLSAQIKGLQYFYLAVTAVVVIAVLLALAGLARSLTAQVRLARKKDDFISAVSHELRTPLTGIRMFTEMLEKDWVKTEEKRKEYYTSMRQETERLSRLIENVLDFSRIQRKMKKYNFAIGDLNESVRRAIDMFRPCAEQAGFKIQTELADLGPLTFDKDAAAQIVINLLDNAVKYAKDAPDKTVTVRTLKQDGRVILEVEDHGPGIPRKYRQKVFEEFYRCADESTRETTGTGLGLALVKRFVMAHRGSVAVLSAKPAGCLLRISFPAA